MIRMWLRLLVSIVMSLALSLGWALTGKTQLILAHTDVGDELAEWHMRPCQQYTCTIGQGRVTLLKLSTGVTTSVVKSGYSANYRAAHPLPAADTDDPGWDPGPGLPPDPFPDWHQVTAAHSLPAAGTDDPGWPEPLDGPYQEDHLLQSA